MRSVRLWIRHWQDVVNALMGLALAVSPWLLGYSGQSMAMSSAVVVGLALAAVSVGAVVMPSAWEEWTEGALGLGLVAAPWVLGFTFHEAATFAHMAIGLVVLALAAWTLGTDREYTPWLHRDRVMH